VAAQREGGADEMTDADCGDAIKSGHVHDEFAPATRKRRQWKTQCFRSGNVKIANKYKLSGIAECGDCYLHDTSPFMR